MANEFRRISWLFGAFRRKFARNDISAIFRRIFATPIAEIPTLPIWSGVSRFDVLSPTLPIFIRFSRFIMKFWKQEKKMLILSIFLRSKCKTLCITLSYPIMSRPVSPLNTACCTDSSFSNSPVSTGAHLLTKKPEDSGYEIGSETESDSGDRNDVKMQEMPLERN